MLSLNAITKAYNGQPIIDNFSVSVAAGEIVCINGPSGVGKTTLVRIALGLLQPDSGQRKVQTEAIACVFQDTPLVPWLSVKDNMAFILSGSIIPTTAKGLEAHIQRWLYKLGLSEVADKKPYELSGGMQRRLAIACGFAVSPGLYILDEPFAFLDQHWQQIIADELVAQAHDRGMSVFMTSHQQEPVKRMGARIIEL